MTDDLTEKYIDSLDATFDGEIEDLDLPEDVKEGAIKIRDSLFGDSKDNSDNND